MLARDRRVRTRLDRKPEFTRECCKDTHNLRYSLVDNVHKDILVLKCKHCHALHRRQFMEGFPMPKVV